MFASIVIYPLRLFAMLYGSVRRSQVWEAILGFEFRQLHNFPWFRDLVLFIQAEGKNLELLAMVLWTIWYRRNQLRVVSKDFPISQVVPQASHALSDIKQFNVSPILTGRHQQFLGLVSMASSSKGLLQDQFQRGYISRIRQGRVGISHSRLARKCFGITLGTSSSPFLTRYCLSHGYCQGDFFLLIC